MYLLTYFIISLLFHDNGFVSGRYTLNGYSYIDLMRIIYFFIHFFDINEICAVPFFFSKYRIRDCSKASVIISITS